MTLPLWLKVLYVSIGFAFVINFLLDILGMTEHRIRLMAVVIFTALFAIQYGISEWLYSENQKEQGEAEMGYYTQFKLELLDLELQPINEVLEVIEEFRQFSMDAEYSIDEYGDTYQSAKWYSGVRQQEMKEFSPRYPEIVFKVLGEGEEAGDTWHEYYVNGKMQRCEAVITYPPFDKDKLV